MGAAKKETIQANDEDIRTEVVRIASSQGRKAAEIWEELQERNLVGGLIRQVTELKALDWVVNRVTSSG